jgi:hypothetical protein
MRPPVILQLCAGDALCMNEATARVRVARGNDLASVLLVCAEHLPGVRAKAERAGLTIQVTDYPAARS